MPHINADASQVEHSHIEINTPPPTSPAVDAQARKRYQDTSPESSITTGRSPQRDRQFRLSEFRLHGRTVVTQMRLQARRMESILNLDLAGIQERDLFWYAQAIRMTAQSVGRVQGCVNTLGHAVFEILMAAEDGEAAEEGQAAEEVQAAEEEKSAAFLDTDEVFKDAMSQHDDSSTDSE